MLLYTNVCLYFHKCFIDKYNIFMKLNKPREKKFSEFLKFTQIQYKYYICFEFLTPFIHEVYHLPYFPLL